jgi:Amt family ammonium transporter
MIWGNGLLAKMGVLDFAGGIVVHNIAGMAALASVLYVGRRRIGDSIPHSIPLVALGAGLLWFGWYGFNAGSELRVDAVTGLAFLNTDIAASFAGTIWMLLAWIFEKKPKFLGLLTGAVAGLATITPCAGYVTPTSAVIIGSLAGTVCYFAVNLKNRLNWDDAWNYHAGTYGEQSRQCSRSRWIVTGQCQLLCDTTADRYRLVHLCFRIHLLDADDYQ